MLQFLPRFINELIVQVPCALARLLLIAITLGTGYFYVSIKDEIAELRLKQTSISTEQVSVLAALQELTLEVRGYRQDIIEQNKELRRVKR